MPDPESQYLASVLAHDPAESPGEILRLRRRFLGRSAARPEPAGRAAAPAPEARPREREARLTTQRWLAGSRRAQAEAAAEAREQRARLQPAHQKSAFSSPWAWIILAGVVIRLIAQLTKDR